MSSTPQRRPRILTLPGWLDSGPAHWQSRWEALHGFSRVQQADWVWPRRGDWLARLEDILLAEDRTAVLVAHSLGCHLVSAWAAHSQHAARVQAALLVAPPDTERADMPPQLSSWRRIVRRRLPFASLLVYSEDDPFCSVPRALQMAADWGARVHNLGPRGHINADSGLGDWPEGLGWLADMSGAPHHRA